MDKFKIDSHKLIYHIGRVNDWLKGVNIYPIYIEIALAGGCNHRCTYCALDFMGYKRRFPEVKIFKKRLFEMASLGVKSIMYAGEGEPLLHKDAGAIINYTRDTGMDIGLTTNAVLLNKKMADSILKSLSWIKVSINGATKETYKKIHRANPDDFDRVMKNIAYVVKLKRQKRYKCVLGMQLLLLPENSGEVLDLAERARDLGIDYLVIKPYSHHPFSKNNKYQHIKYKKYLYLKDKLEPFNNKVFSVVFRINTMKKWDEGRRSYEHCYGLPFWTYVDAGGNLWGCSAYLEDKRFLYGNIYKNTFKEIWESSKRKSLLGIIEKGLDLKNCRVNCRMDEINRYLWELKNPPEHVNFI